MRLLIATPLYPPEIGGPATHTLFLERELPKHDIEVVVVQFGSVHGLPKGIRHVLYFFKLIAKGKQVDVIYALDPVSVGLPAMIAARLLKKRFTVRIAGDRAWETAHQKYQITESPRAYARNNNVPRYIQLLRRIERRVARSAEAIVVPSRYMQEVIQVWGVPKKKIHVVYNCVSVEKAGDQKNVLRQLLQFDGKLMIFAGRLVALKRVAGIVKVMPNVVKVVPDVKLLIIGDGPEKSAIEALIKKKQIEKQVTLIDSLSRDVLHQYIRASDVFVLNAVHETFSNLLLEAMSLGTPIVATNVGGTPEMITDQTSGLLVQSGSTKELEQALIQVLTNTTLAQKLSKGGLQKAKEFSCDKQVNKLVKLFV